MFENNIAKQQTSKKPETANKQQNQIANNNIKVKLKPPILEPNNKQSASKITNWLENKKQQTTEENKPTTTPKIETTAKKTTAETKEINNKQSTSKIKSWLENKNVKQQTKEDYKQ